jgi:putative ABC transport system permease protein
MRPPFYQLNSSVIVPFSDRAFTEFSRVDWALYVSVSDLNMSKDTFVRHVSSTLDPEIIRIWSSREVGGRAEDLLAMLTIMSSGANAIMLLIAVAATATLVSFDVIRRFREIAIRRAVGASRRQIVQAILIRVSVLALLALPAGALLGYILSIYLVAPLGQLIVSGSWTFNLLSPSLLNAVAVMVIGVLLAAGYPAYLAAHVDPTALLRRGQD